MYINIIVVFKSFVIIIPIIATNYSTYVNLSTGNLPCLSANDGITIMHDITPRKKAEPINPIFA